MSEEMSFWNVAIITLSGAVIGGIISYFAAVRINRRQHFNVAAAEFRSAFIETKRLLDKNRLYNLSTQYDDPVFDILNAHILNHERAKIRFSAFIHKNDLLAFDEAWDTYYSKSHGCDDYPLTDYACDKCSKTNKPRPDAIKQKSQMALNRIKRLLYFAKHK